jgi:outer membrane protein assembly factor BamB
MMAVIRALTVSMAAAGLASGCGLFESDNVRVPSELPEIQTTLPVAELWDRSFGDGVDDLYMKLRPLSVDGRVFVTDYQGRVAALNAEDGSILWDVDLEVDVGAGVNGDEVLLAIGTQDGDVIALSAEDGQELWRRRLSSEVMAISAVDLGILVVRTNDSRVYGLDRETGAVSWQTGRTAPVLTLRGQSRPVLDSGRAILGFDDGSLSAISLVRGNVTWQEALDVPEGRSELERLVDIDGTLRVRDGIIFAVAYHGRVGALTLSDGRILWAREFSSHNGLDVDETKVYVTDDDSNVWALDRRTGASLWKQDKLTYRRLSAPAVVGDYVIVGDFEGYVHWMASADGHFVARTRVDSDGILAQPLVVDGRAYVLGNGGEIAVLEPGSPQS